MSIKQHALSSAIKILKIGSKLLGRDKTALVNAQIAEELTPIIVQSTDFGNISFFSPGKLPVMRAYDLLTKEPETIEWINNFNEADVFWDIGANIGVFSLYAALRRLSVIAIEPSPSNYYLLCKNIEINNMDERISALCIAFNDVNKLDFFYMANTELGSALNSFGEPIDWQGEYFRPSYKQSILGFTIDDFIEQFKPVFPTHIKIDVDGIEDKIISGAKNTISDERLKSVLVELYTTREGYCSNVNDALEKAGLHLHKKHVNLSDNTQFSGVCNHIYVR